MLLSRSLNLAGLSSIGIGDMSYGRRTKGAMTFIKD